MYSLVLATFLIGQCNGSSCPLNQKPIQQYQKYAQTIQPIRTTQPGIVYQFDENTSEIPQITIHVINTGKIRTVKYRRAKLWDLEIEIPIFNDILPMAHCDSKNGQITDIYLDYEKGTSYTNAFDGVMLIYRQRKPALLFHDNPLHMKRPSEIGN